MEYFIFIIRNIYGTIFFAVQHSNWTRDYAELSSEFKIYKMFSFNFSLIFYYIFRYIEINGILSWAKAETCD